MMKIHQILNPSGGDDEGNSKTSLPASSTPLEPLIMLPKLQKIPKDAPIFSEGTRIVGNVNFPPYEAGDDIELAAQHNSFHVYPLGKIYQKGVRHIPYNSEKKDFLQKTGRDAFEIFQYTYKTPGDDKEYVVVWDYNVGLVRITPFFKSCKYSKTTPAKALRDNPGLADISYSITGGALVCQGYWVPYHAAKAMAATFCYDIRWALTPVFGNDFPASCIRPKDSTFGKFRIDPSIVQYCHKETARFRKEGEQYCLNPCTSSAKTPTKMHLRSPSWNTRVTREQRLRTADVESGYGTDTEKNDSHLYSPPMSPRQFAWTSVNGSQARSSPYTASSSAIGSPLNNRNPLDMRTAISLPGACSHQSLGPKRTRSKVTISEKCDDKIIDTQVAADLDSGNDQALEHPPGNAVHSRVDIDAAEMLIALSAGEILLPPQKRTRRVSKY